LPLTTAFGALAGFTREKPDEAIRGLRSPANAWGTVRLSSARRGSASITPSPKLRREFSHCVGFLGEGMDCCRALFDHRGVFLDSLIHFLDGRIDLAETRGLLLGASHEVGFVRRQSEHLHAR
jgi:hypothetical protein